RSNVHTTILIAEKKPKNPLVTYRYLKENNSHLLSVEVPQFKAVHKERTELQDYWLFTTKDNNKIIRKIEKKGKLLGEISEIEKGSTSGKNNVFTISKELVEKYKIE